MKTNCGFTIFKRSFWVVLTVFFTLLLVFCVVGASVANSYADIINKELDIDAYVKVQMNAGEESDMEYFKSDYVLHNDDGSIKTETEIFEANGEEIGRYTYQLHDDEAMRAASEAVAEQVAVEGTVLLWNDETASGKKALPLASGSSVSLFGTAQRTNKYIMYGKGSGRMNRVSPLGGSLQNALAMRGLSVDPDLVSRYNSLSSYGSDVSDPTESYGDNYYSRFNVNEAPFSEVESAVDVAAYGDAAIMVINRNAGEDQDIRPSPTANNMNDSYADGTKNYLELSEEEADVLENLNRLKSEGLKSIILVINSANPMQFKNILDDKYGIDACLWVGMGGTASYMQVADALTNNGGYAVSGRTPDTLAMDNRSAPSFENFGNFSWSDWSEELPDLEREGKGRYTTHNLKYIVYQEGEYVGYRYYETRYEDYVLGTGNAGGNAGATDGNGWNYSEEVAFPFGYGIGYTDFTYSAPVFSEDDDEITVSVTVTNSGSNDGKEVVQVYMQRPYKDGGIEKPAVELVGFAKTELLAPGADQTVTVTVDKENMRTYDAYGEGTYILEQGEYRFAVGRNAHDALNNIIIDKEPNADRSRMYFFEGDGNGDANNVYTVNVNKTDTKIYSVSEESGKEVKIENRLSDADLNLYEGTKNDQSITYLSRSDWNGTYPAAVDLECTNEIMVRDMQYAAPVEEEEGDVLPDYGKSNGLTLAMYMDIPFGDPLWNDLLDQMSFEDQSQLVGRGFKMIAPVIGISSPDLIAADGPAGVKVSNSVTGDEMAFPSEPVMAATFDTELIKKLGVAFGHEALHADVSEIYAPGANIHRSPYGGRNWEYFSEDGVLSGKMLCAEISGIQSKGVIVMTKHFALNDQETNRYAGATFFDEQTAREIYLRPFEIAIREGGMNGVMSSFNRIGCTWVGAHRGLLTGILREEWGFTGICQTDSSGNVAHMTGSYGGVAGDDAANIRAEAVVAGTDLWLDGTAGNKLDWMAGSENNATVALALREACHRILYNVLHSNAMNGMDSSTRIDPITVWWQYALMAAQIAVGVLTAISLAMAIISFVLASRKKKAVALSPVKASVGASVKTDTGKGNYVRDEIGSDGENGGQGGPEDEPPVKKSWFARHRKLLVLIGSIVIAAIVIVAIVVPVTTCGGATAPAPDGGGNDENPSVQTHVCENKCPVCGGCIDLECDDPVCATKCGEGRQPHVYEAENAARTFGDNGYMSRLTEGETTSLTNVYGNRNATLTFTVEVSESVTASLSVTMTGYVKTTDFSDVLSVSVKNGEKSSVMTTTAEVPRNGAGTAGFNEVMLGCIQLGAGENTITFTVVNSVNLTLSDNGYDNGFDIDKITLYGDSLSADAHVCTMVCPDCGGCLDADCGDEACAEKCGDDKSATYVFEAEDAAFGAGTNGLPKKESNGEFVGNFSENAGATITFSFNAESAGKGTLIVGASYRNVERAFTDGFNVYVNDPEKTSPMSSPAAVPGSRSVGGDWNIWDQSARVILGCIDIAEGENTVVLEVKSDNTNTAFNLDYIRIATDVALPGAEVDGPEPEPGVHVCESECPVCGKCTDMTCEDPVCAEKCGDALEQTVRFEAENARLTDGAKGGVKVESNGKYVGGLSENRGAKVTFTFNVAGGSEGNLTATLYAGSTYRSTDISFTDGFNVYVNGNLIENRASKVPSSASIGRTGNVWDVTFMVNLGCIELVDGVNTIELEVASSDASTTTNLDCIELRCSSALTAGSVSE